MSHITSRDAETVMISLDKKTLKELRRLLKRDKINFIEFTRRSVTAYAFIYPGPDYRPTAVITE